MDYRKIFFIAVSVGIYYALKWLYGKRNWTSSDKPSKIFLWFSVILALVLIFGTPYFGTKVPGSFFERDIYDGMFYVNLFPNAQKVKSYRVPAKIVASIESSPDYGDGEDYYREYKIEFATMPNGGKVTFFDSNEPLYIGQMVIMFDDKQRYWGVELTKRKAK